MDTELKTRISGLSDDELLQIVGPKVADYRQEAIDYASQELTARGVTFSLGVNQVTEEPDLYASRGQRFANFVIDIFLIALISVGVEAIVGKLTLFIFFFYYFGFETWLQRTPGKFITRTKVAM